MCTSMNVAARNGVLKHRRWCYSAKFTLAPVARPRALPVLFHPVPVVPSLHTMASRTVLTPTAAGLLATPTVTAPPLHFQRNVLDWQTDKNQLLAIGGHRGMGANVIRNGSLAPVWRENTLRSFQAAAASGAAFVEFDVQVTGDGVPVVWHDDLVEYGDPANPTRCAVADLTAVEFQALGALSASGKCQQLSVVRKFRHAGSTAAAVAAEAEAGAASIQTNEIGEVLTSQHRRWCCEADDSFPTLQQLFASLPANLAFNIEVKMATPHDLAVTSATEVNRVVKPILDVVSRCSRCNGGSSRQVVFSSFDPEVCRALRAAQHQHPVLFLSTGGRDWHADPRRMSLTAAVEEAMSSRLSGVVVDSGALMAAPEAAALARSNGLKLLTYGLENDSADWVLKQQQLGVAGVIVDDLQGLIAALTAANKGTAGQIMGPFVGQFASVTTATTAVLGLQGSLAAVVQDAPAAATALMVS